MQVDKVPPSQKMLTEKFEKLQARLSRPAYILLLDQLNKVLDAAEQDNLSTCGFCAGTGIAVLDVVNMDHNIGRPRKTGKTKEIQCPNGCNSVEIVKVIEKSRDIMMQETKPYIEQARNPTTPWA